MSTQEEDRMIGEGAPDKKPMPPRPSIGRIVHVWRKGHSKPQAAIVTDVRGDDGYMCDLAVFDNTGAHEGGVIGVMYGEADDTSLYQRWCWPPRV